MSSKAMELSRFDYDELISPEGSAFDETVQPIRWLGQTCVECWVWFYVLPVLAIILGLSLGMYVAPMPARCSVGCCAEFCCGMCDNCTYPDLCRSAPLTCYPYPNDGKLNRTCAPEPTRTQTVWP